MSAIATCSDPMKQQHMLAPALLLAITSLACMQDRSPPLINLLSELEGQFARERWRVVLFQTDPMCFANRATGLGVDGDRIIQRGPVSTIRMGLPLEGWGSLHIRMAYEDSPDAPREATIRLLKDGAVLLEQASAIEAGVCSFGRPWTQGGSFTLELVHSASLGTGIPLRAVAVGECATGLGGQIASTELLELLGMLSDGAYDARRGIPQGRRITLSMDGCTRDCLIVTPGDTLLIPIGAERRGMMLRLWLAGAEPMSHSAPRLLIEAKRSGTWELVGRWKSPGGLQWKTVEVSSKTLPPGTEGLRLIVEGRGAIGALAEPLLVSEADIRGPANLLLIDLDTMRADRLGCYGYRERPTSVRLDSLVQAKGFAVFGEACSPAPWTVPATARFLASRFLGATEPSNISTETTMLAEIMRENGYYCAAYTGGVFLRTPGFEQGFHEYHWSAQFGKVEETLGPASTWLRSAVAPFFLFIQTYETHMPYTRTTFCRDLPRGRLGDPELLGSRFMPDSLAYCGTLTSAESLYVQALYDGGVRKASDAVADLFCLMDTLGLWEKTMVVVLSDHGEELFDHLNVFAWHSHSLYEEILRVPFMIYNPARARYRFIEQRVSTVDLVPTIADALLLRWDSDVDGVSLHPLICGQDLSRPIPIMSSGLAEQAPVEGTCVYSGGFKYLEFVPRTRASVPGLSCLRHSPPGRELYHVDVDPGEATDLSVTRPRTARAMADSLCAARQRAGNPIAGDPRRTGASMSRDLRRQLEALGYVTER
jgi:arylsulfatase